MKILLIIAAVVVAAIVLVLVVGFILPSAHVAAVRAHYDAPAERVFATVADVESAPTWRTGVKKVEVLEREPLRWRETADWGTLTFVRDERVPPSRIVARIADESEGFGGTWTYVLAPAGGGTRLTITEDGHVDNALFRFMARFVFGYSKTLEDYLRDLGEKLGESVTVQPAAR